MLLDIIVAIIHVAMISFSVTIFYQVYSKTNNVNNSKNVKFLDSKTDAGNRVKVAGTNLLYS